MYQVVKGWPCEGALDETLIPATGVTIAPGSVACLDATGNAIVATSVEMAADAISYFVIDNDNLKGGLVGLKGQCIIECDADHYVAGAYAVGDNLTADGGKFAVAGVGAKVLGRVLNFNAVTGKMRLVWTAIG